MIGTPNEILSKIPFFSEKKTNPTTNVATYFLL